MKSNALYPEGLSPEGMVSVSQLQSFISCSQKWAYGYLEGLSPRVERPYLTIGKLCHIGMEAAMRASWEMQVAGTDEDGEDVSEYGRLAIRAEWLEYMGRVPFLDEEVPAQEELLDDALSVFSQAINELDPGRWEVVSIGSPGEEVVPALELHFLLPCACTEGLHGYIDAILRDRVTGHIWCTDYKFRKSLEGDDKERFSLQNAVYSRACDALGVPITGTMTWQHYNVPSADPAVLKDGSVSRARIRTTWEHYRVFLEGLGLDPADYAEMEGKLSDVEWYRETLEYRNEETVDRIWDQVVLPSAAAVAAARLGHGVWRSMYPWNCRVCQFAELCQAELRGYDADYIRAHDFTEKTHR